MSAGHSFSEKGYTRLNAGKKYIVINLIFQLNTGIGQSFFVFSQDIEKLMTHQALADAVGIIRATINAMEKGTYNPSLELAFRLARFFKVDIQRIFFVED